MSTAWTVRLSRSTDTKTAVSSARHASELPGFNRFIVSLVRLHFAAVARFAGMRIPYHGEVRRDDDRARIDAISAETNDPWYMHSALELVTKALQ